MSSGHSAQHTHLGSSVDGTLEELSLTIKCLTGEKNAAADAMYCLKSYGGEHSEKNIDMNVGETLFGRHFPTGGGSLMHTATWTPTCW